MPQAPVVPSRFGAMLCLVLCTAVPGPFSPVSVAQSRRETSLSAVISALTKEPAVARGHWGVQVTTLDGSSLAELNASQLFQPASNAKLFTTAAAIALLHGPTTFETKVVARGTYSDPTTLDGDLYLVGGGDPNLSGRTIPYVHPDKPGHDPLRYLAEMADQVAATGLKTIRGAVVGDDTLFPFEPYPPDWTIEDAVWGYGAPVSALTINDNQIVLTIKPGAQPGAAPSITAEPSLAFYTLENSLITGTPKTRTTIQVARTIGSKTVRIYGSIASDAPPDTEEIALEDPAEYAAAAFTGMLTARGITIQGPARANHRLPLERRSFLEQAREPLQLKTSQVAEVGCTDGAASLPALHERVLASHRSALLEQDVVITNKESQNLHAELMLHALAARFTSTASTAQGARVVRQFLLDAGLKKDDFVFYDGSGLSGHDLVTPRATASLLAFAAKQPWFASWKASLPIGGIDGSLEHRFTEPPLKGNVFAKTGTLGEARALSGYLVCASGRTVIFSIMVGNHLPGTAADREVMDRIVAAIAVAN